MKQVPLARQPNTAQSQGATPRRPQGREKWLHPGGNGVTIKQKVGELSLLP